MLTFGWWRETLIAEHAEILAAAKMAERRIEALSVGYDEEFVNPLDDDFTCLICQVALREPVLTRCGHRFCRGCLEQCFSR